MALVGVHGGSNAGPDSRSADRYQYGVLSGEVAGVLCPVFMVAHAVRETRSAVELARARWT